MRVLFLYGSLEPGHDGVGDYTRRLAVSVLQQEHQAAIIALNDAHVAEGVVDPQVAEGVAVPVLRLPAAWPTAKRLARAKEWLAAYRPDWVSLQLVLFAYHEKGLAFRLGKQLKALGGNSRWHIMFHELWVGLETTASRKHIWWGWLQRRAVASLLASLQPKVVHTQTKLYQSQLAKLGVVPYYLPLFGNIPVMQLADSLRAGSGIAFTKQPISLVIFGTIHAGALIEELAAEVAQYAEAENQEVVLTLLGRCGPEQQRWTTAWQAAGLRVVALGEQSPEQISEVLSAATLGISTNPIALVEKSGTVAAMREHGLPVLCVREAWQARGEAPVTPPRDIAEYRPGSFAAYMRQPHAVPTDTTATAVAQKFIADLASFST